MTEVRDTAAGTPDPAQAAALALLLDEEAGWENLRQAPADDPGVGGSPRGLLGRQKAYDAFRARLAAYNGRYRPAHTPELLLNTPARLSAWCRRVRDLYARI